MRAVASWCFRHKLIVAALWLVAIVGASTIERGVGSNYVDNFNLPSTQSAQARALLERSAPKVSGDSDQIVVAVNHGKVTAPGVQQRLDKLVTRVKRLPHVTEVGSPFVATGARQVAPSGRVAFATLTFDIGADTISGHEAAAYDQLVSSASGHGVTFAAGGQVAEDGDPSSPASGMPIGFLAAGIVLFVVFGTLPAVLMPLLTAGVSLGTGLAVVGLLSNVLDVASFSGQLAMLIGLGVGVDYALFIVTRYRQGRMRGLGPEQAVVDAIDTSGRAVMFAGIIVCIAMLGMILLGVSFLYGVAIAAAVTVAFTVLAALTLLPALLSLFGGRVLRRRDRVALAGGNYASCDRSPAWTRWTEILTKRPALFAVGAIVLMLVIAAPFTSMRLGTTDAGSDPHSTTTYHAYELLAKGFGPGYNGPMQLVASVDSSAQRSEFAAVARAVAHTPGVASVTTPSFLPSHDGRAPVAQADVYSASSPDSSATGALLSTLRYVVIPGAAAHSGLRVLVGGQTAVFADFASVLDAKLPLFVGIVVLVSSLLLMLIFRSLLIPAAAALMNLLSTAAALGVVTAIFQFGWLGSVLEISPGPIEAFVPVLMFPILFGLSMDYEVFLLSRIYEEWHRHGDNRAAIMHGLASTARTITAAAAIMVLVFSAFVLGGQRIIELFGIGLASAVFLDALVVRSVIIPASMLLLGRANWHLPPVLDRVLPHVRVEGQSLREVPARLAEAAQEVAEGAASSVAARGLRTRTQAPPA